jgi:hypothetical protein
VKFDTVGPGEYDISRAIRGKKGGPTWHPPKMPKKSSLAANANKSTVTIGD